jgi:hypothetical protein
MFDQFGYRRTNIKYERPFPPRQHSDSSFRGLYMDEGNNATVSTVLGLSNMLKVGTSDALCLLARIHQGNP